MSIQTINTHLYTDCLDNPILYSPARCVQVFSICDIHFRVYIVQSLALDIQQKVPVIVKSSRIHSVSFHIIYFIYLIQLC